MTAQCRTHFGRFFHFCRWVRELLDYFKTLTKKVVTQWDLIVVANQAFNEVEKGSAWKKSFIRVNFCPSQRRAFKEYLREVEDIVSPADRFFTERVGLYDAMPAVWQHLSEQERRQLCSVLDSFEDNWSTENLKTVMQLGFVKLDDVEKLRGCWLVTKEDPSVFVTPVPKGDENGNQPTKKQGLLDSDFSGFSFAPKHLLDPYVKDKEPYGPHFVGPLPHGIERYPRQNSRQLAADLFNNMTNFVASTHGWHTGTDLVPSPYLQVRITDDQVDLLNPTPRDVQIGAILDQCVGKKAEKALAKRRIDFITGNINSYARALNGPREVGKMQTFNQLTASISELQQEKNQQKKAADAKKKKAEEENAVKAAEKNRKKEEERERLVPICADHVAKGLDHCLFLTVPEKRDVLKYHFEHPQYNNKIKKAIADQLLRESFAAMADTAAAESSTTLTADTDGGDDPADIPLPSLAAASDDDEPDLSV